MNILELAKVAENGDEIICNFKDGAQANLRMARDDYGWNLINASYYRIQRLVEADYIIVEPKYFLKHRWLKGDDGEDMYLAWNSVEETHTLINSKESGFVYKTWWSRMVLEEIKQKYDTDLSDFEMINIREGLE